MLSLESHQRGDSNEYTQYKISQYQKESHPKLTQIDNSGICSKGLKKEFETAVVNELSVFEPLKFYCSLFRYFQSQSTEPFGLRLNCTQNIVFKI